MFFLESFIGFLGKASQVSDRAAMTDKNGMQSAWFRVQAVHSDATA